MKYENRSKVEELLLDIGGVKERLKALKTEENIQVRVGSMCGRSAFVDENDPFCNKEREALISAVVKREENALEELLLKLEKM